MNPTPEQTRIIDAFMTGDDMVIEAGAGTGKTSTLRMLAEAMPHSKRCPRCDKVKSCEDFPRDASRKDGRFPYCKGCNAAHVRADYRTNRSKRRAAGRARYFAQRDYWRDYKRRRQQSGTAFLQAVKLTLGCIDCGRADDPSELHFDHRPGESKAFELGMGASRSFDLLVAEMDKCDVRCRRCHARRHALAGDYFKREPKAVTA